HRFGRTELMDPDPCAASGNRDPLRRRQPRGSVSGAAVRGRLSKLQDPRASMAVAVRQELRSTGGSPRRVEYPLFAPAKNLRRCRGFRRGQEAANLSATTIRALEMTPVLLGVSVGCIDSTEETNDGHV